MFKLNGFNAFLIVLVVAAAATSDRSYAQSPFDYQGDARAGLIRRDPDWFREARKATGLDPKINPRGLTVVTGRYGATRERAERDARERLRRVVADWLAPDAPRSFVVGEAEIDRLIRERRVEPVALDVGTVYLAAYRVDFSPQSRNHILRIYDDQLVKRRLVELGAAIAFILALLGAIAGYIRADEATKGYYTNKLRLVAAGAIGAAAAGSYFVAFR